VIRYGLEHPDLRHREMAWQMVDEDVAYLSSSTVYRILREADLVHRWERCQERQRREREGATQSDERWQSDLRYVRVGGRWYYLITFADEYSRYIVHHELLRWMDGDSVSLAAQAAVETLPEGKHPVIQTDHGSGYISREFKFVLSQKGIGHHLIHPHCPEENGLIERIQRTLGERIEEYELEHDTQAREVVRGIIRWYNEERLHSAIGFLRPMDRYRGEPEKILAERRRKLLEARRRRREENLTRRRSTGDFQPPRREENHNLFQTLICPG